MRERFADMTPTAKTELDNLLSHELGSALVPEFAVSDWLRSKSFYCSLLCFECVYERIEEGFCFLRLG